MNASFVKGMNVYYKTVNGFKQAGFSSTSHPVWVGHYMVSGRLGQEVGARTREIPMWPGGQGPGLLGPI